MRWLRWAIGMAAIAAGAALMMPGYIVAHLGSVVLGDGE